MFFMSGQNLAKTVLFMRMIVSNDPYEMTPTDLSNLIILNYNSIK